MNETGTTIQEFLEISQAVNGQFDTLVNIIAMFATSLGVIVAIMIVFFA